MAEDGRKLTPEQRARRTEIEKRSKAKTQYRVVLAISRNIDSDIVEQLERQGSKQGYIKRIIREDIERQKQNS